VLRPSREKRKSLVRERGGKDVVFESPKSKKKETASTTVTSDCREWPPFLSCHYKKTKLLGKSPPSTRTALSIRKKKRPLLYLAHRKKLLKEKWRLGEGERDTLSLLRPEKKGRREKKKKGGVQVPEAKTWKGKKKKNSSYSTPGRGKEKILQPRQKIQAAVLALPGRKKSPVRNRQKGHHRQS